MSELDFYARTTLVMFLPALAAALALPLEPPLPPGELSRDTQGDPPPDRGVTTVWPNRTRVRLEFFHRGSPATYRHNACLPSLAWSTGWMTRGPLCDVVRQMRHH